jgi:ubiquinone/menaquinone biosynthesis C-methylase UbiE
MSTAMDWVAHAGGGPEQYEEFLVPAIFSPLAEVLVGELGLEPGMSVLDVACGTGALTRALARRVGPGGDVTGVDVSPGMVAVAREHGHEQGSAAIEYLESSAEELPVEAGAFDVVTCQQGLQFFADRLEALRVMRAALAPGGLIAIATWAEPEGVWIALAAALGRHIGLDAGARMLAPFSLADAGELRTLLEDAGFEDVVVHWRTLTMRFAPRRDFVRRLVLATPLAGDFEAASSEQQQRIIADVAEAIAACDGGEDEVLQPITTNVAFGRRL